MRRRGSLRSKQYVDAFLALPLCKALGDRAQLALWVKRAGEERSTMAV